MRREPVGLMALGLLLACGGAEQGAQPAETPESSMEAPASRASVTIVEPSEGATLPGTSIHVVLQAEGIEVVPAGELREGTGHQHLYLDAEIGEPGSTIPAGQPNILHLGQGQSEADFTEVASGEHRVIAVVADGLHRILDPLVVDTVTFVVGGR